VTGSPGAALADTIVDRLRPLGTEKRAVGEKAYLKSDLDFFGVTVVATRTVVRDAWRGAGRPPHPVIVEAVERLWETRVHECRGSAVELLCFAAGEITAADAPLIERLLRESRTWALVDPLAVEVAGRLDDIAPGIGDTIERWATDDDFWIRRSALLAHLRSLRRGEGEPDRFLRLADGMLDETGFFIRKAIGWVLREMAKRRPGEVSRWLRPRLARASGVTVREAVKYLADGDELREIHRSVGPGNRRRTA
jgi:3-methyladenine DNA glycosylase AlkD